MNTNNTVDHFASNPVIQTLKKQHEDKEKLHAAKAKVMWDSFTYSERTLVRFGMFPHDKMRDVEAEGCWDSHMIVCALMDVASKNGGMRA